MLHTACDSESTSNVDVLRLNEQKPCAPSGNPEPMIATSPSCSSRRTTLGTSTAV